jgi:hypothetical protein
MAVHASGGALNVVAAVTAGCGRREAVTDERSAEHLITSGD